jgi:nickel transport system ATP-binding protein
MASASALTVRDLHVVLRNGDSFVPLVKGVSFAVGEGEILGLIGQSGCGKSVTCLSLLDLLPTNLSRTQGEIWLQGRLISGLASSALRPYRGRDAAMILQNPMSCFNPIATVRSHFAETLSSHGLGKSNGFMQQAEESLAEVGFPNPNEILGLYPFQMSGGMLQRVMVSLALCLHAPFLIADEPTTDLDVLSQAKILDLLRVLQQKRKMGILLVTHDLGVIARLAGTVAVMEQGEIVETGPVNRIFSEPRHPFTKMLLEAHFGLYQAVSSLPQVKEALHKR